MYNRPIQPLPEGMADAIGSAINQIQHVKENKHKRPADKEGGEKKKMDSPTPDTSDLNKKTMFVKGDTVPMDESTKMGTITVDSDEDRNKRAAIYRANKEKKNQHKMDEAKAPVTDKEDDGDGMDPVGKGDSDIDNDGDSDKSDRYLKARRKAIGKAIKKESYSSGSMLSENLKKTIEMFNNDTGAVHGTPEGAVAYMFKAYASTSALPLRRIRAIANALSDANFSDADYQKACSYFVGKKILRERGKLYEVNF